VRPRLKLRFSFVPGFSEYTIHVRGSLAAATVDLERNTYSLHHHRPISPDFDTYAMVAGEARNLIWQARRTLGKYVLSKLHLCARGNPYGASIARAMEAFYDASGLPLDERVDAGWVHMWSAGVSGWESWRICLPKNSFPRPLLR